MVRPDSTYLITGGLGDLGRHAARYLVDQGARHLVLIGRRAPDTAAEAELDRMRSQGAQVVARPVDVCEGDQVKALLADMDESMPPLAGVIHAAGTLDDRMVLQLDQERFDTVWNAKAVGAWHLHQATQGRHLDFFVLYSSAASLLGSPGQGNYAAANAFLDALAWYRRQQGRPGLSINWGPWSQIGLAARGSRDAVLSGHGIASLTPQAGTDALHRILRANGQVGILPIDPDRLRDTARSGLLPDLLAELPILGAAGDDAAGVGDLRTRLLALEPGRRRRAVLTGHCTDEVARVLRLDPAQVVVTAPLAGMGFDSLMSLELRKRLEKSLGVPLPTTLAWRYPSIEALVPFLAERMAIDLEPASTGSSAPEGQLPGAGGQSDADDLAGRSSAGSKQYPAGIADEPEDLDQMSAADLEHLLRTTITEISGSD